MTIELSRINWIQLDESLRLMMKGGYDVIPLSPGLEADVMKIVFDDQPYVLKIWNKDSKPNVGNQYKLLSKLRHNGICVSTPYGWGRDKEHNQVLLTSYDGVPVTELTSSKLAHLAQHLMEVHRFPLNEAGAGQDGAYISRYDFVGYFFPSIELYEDISTHLSYLLQRVQLRQDCLIHGDYNLGNILEMEDDYTIIDWTNGQLGDPRYDVAWSVFLITIYNGESYGEMYCAEFRRTASYSLEDEGFFEAMACLRWILLSRVTDVPMGPNVMQRVHRIAIHNPYLNESLLQWR
ncbi:aminoglycoside phosphotransferase family protein [Paenibacillus illinoisensis]|uniref:aminoglycoside phosphotransferase family protein n=1 Tax=Paenibacillus illinoisensis TaxID=59845 RepID=UPI00203B0A49|nr:aminoglycoside phosphotransferase family protein [Paenibacillus illinoisensis]MCM3206247.1 aminoglycoside phosphotransferase family protein [Paenibacillus illinoisensis]